MPPGTPTLPDLADPGNPIQTLLGFLNAGGAPDLLSELLQASGRAVAGSEPMLALDLDGDRRLDLAVAAAESDPPHASAHVLRPLAAQAAAGGLVLVYFCQGEQYVLGDPVLVEPDRTPRLHRADDLTGDGIADLTIGWESCGAHTCSQLFDVVSAIGTQLVTRRLAPTDDLPNPEVGVSPDGSVTITGTGIGSIGAGPYRRRTRSWAWDSESQAYAPISEVLEPPHYRIHALLEAEAAARRGEWGAALDLYHRVILDDTLLDWVDPAAERANLTGYSMVRVVVAYVRKGDIGNAQVAYGILQNQYLDGSTGRAYAQLGQAFWEVYSSTADVERSCQAARTYAEAHRAEILEPLYFGYANPAFTPEDVCPQVGL